MKDREKLWNAVEKAENRKDAQLAREFNFALPIELTLEQNIELAKEFVIEAFVSQGMVADLCIHNDKMKDERLQPHAHVMLTLREVTHQCFGRKVREWNAKENLLMWREIWAETANRHLQLHGHDLVIDHRSLKEQGIDLEPQHKIGASSAKEHMAKLKDHERIARENGQKILDNPRIALTAITHQQSTFTHQDIARFVNRHTVDSEQFQAVYDKVKGCEEIVYLGLDDIQRERFTTREMLTVESKMLDRAALLAKSKNHGVRELTKEEALSSRQLSKEQQMAFEHLTALGDLKCVVGFAGTGKSYLLGAAREAWEKEGYQVYGATLSGIAAENLSGSSGIDSRTLASFFYYWDKGEALLTSRSILVIDEAGMIGSRQMGRLLEEAEKAKAKVVLLGDPEQLQAIEAGASFRSLCERTSTVLLTDIRRQRTDWQIKATQEFARGETEQAISRYREHSHVHAFETQGMAMHGLISLWNDARISFPLKTQIMLAYTHQEVRQLNTLARELKRRNGELGEDHLMVTDRGERTFASGDRIYFLKNDRALGVMNGTLGMIELIHGKEMRIRLDRDERSLNQSPRQVTIHLDTYNHIDHGYAATIHKAQGVTVDRSYLLSSKYLDRHATYVAATRHSESLDIFWSKEAFANEQTLLETLSRERAKDMTIDYLRSEELFAKHHSLERGDLTHHQKINQSNLDESQISRYEELFRQEAKAYDALQEGLSLTHQQMDLDAFKADFEKRHPTLALALRERLNSSIGQREAASHSMEPSLARIFHKEVVKV
jgi:Ti-type conjugative transfer relaxase TraA